MSDSITLRRSHLIGIALAGLVLVVLAYLTYQRLSPSGSLSDLQNDLLAIDPAPGQEYTDLSGTIVDLRSFRGKPLIVHSWASWMPLSQADLRELEAVAETHGEQLSVLAINRMEDRVLIGAYLATQPETPHIHYLVDPGDTFYRAVGGYAMPETVFYRADGTILRHVRGVLREEDLRSVLEEFAAE